VLAFLCLPLASGALAQVAPPTVLAEIFRNTDCAACATPSASFESYTTSHPGIVVINYHNGNPSSSDPFYTASLQASLARDQFYGGASGLSGPVAYVDGIFAGSGSQSETEWEAYANAGISKPLNPQFPTVAHGPNGIDTINFSLGPHKLVVANVAIIESQVYYVNSTGAYGRPAGDLWNNVFRTMLPGPNGSEPFSGIKNFSMVYDPSQYSFAGNPQNMTAVMFTQDNAGTGGNNSHQVEALGVVSLARPSSVATSHVPTDRLILYANPVSKNGSFRFSLVRASEVQITLYDLLGREARTLVSGAMPSGETTVELNGTSIPSGIYIARMVVDGRTVDQKKFVSE
jgi:hypothetical protein